MDVEITMTVNEDADKDRMWMKWNNMIGALNVKEVLLAPCMISAEVIKSNIITGKYKVEA